MRFLFAAILFSIPSLLLADDSGRGPFEIRNQFPLHRHHLSFYPTTASTNPEGAYSISSNFITSNTSLKYDSYTIDTESRELNVSFDLGITDRFEVGASSGLIWQGGGILDELVDSWHKWLSLPRGRRDRLPQDDFVIAGDTTDSEFAFTDKGTDLGVTSIFGKYMFLEGKELTPSISFRLETLIPASTVKEAPDKPDTSAAIILSKAFKPLYLYGGGAYLHYFDDTEGSLEYRSGHFEGFFSVEYEWSKNLSLIAASTLINEPTRNLAAGPSRTSYLDMGVKYQVSEELEASIAFRENPGPRKLSTDISGLLGVSYRPLP